MGTFSIIPIWVIMMLMIVSGLFLWRFASLLLEILRNNKAFQEVHLAEIVGKRMAVWRSENSHTYYYLTFELENGERREFRVKSTIYALAVEGDRGELVFQGSRFLAFTRALSKPSSR